MSSNLQGRKRGKSVSFRGQSNDSNFYDNRPRNDVGLNDNRQRNSYRDQTNFNGYNLDESESRIVKLLPDANLTISVNNDFRGTNRGRSKGSRGILKSWSFRDDTEVSNRSYDYYNRGQDYVDDYNMASRRGFETISFQSGNNRGRGRGRGFHNRQQNVSRHSDGDNADMDRDRDRDGDRERFRDREYIQGNDATRGRSKSASDRTRRSRGSFRGRFRGRGPNTQRSSYSNSEIRNSGDTNPDSEPWLLDKEECEPSAVDQIDSGVEPQLESNSSVPDIDNDKSQDEHTETENELAADAADIEASGVITNNQSPSLALLSPHSDCSSNNNADESVSFSKVPLPVDDEADLVRTELASHEDTDHEEISREAPSSEQTS